MLRYGNNLDVNTKNKQKKISRKINGAGDFLQCWFFCFALAPDVGVFWLISFGMYPCASTAAPPDTDGSNTKWISLKNHSWEQHANTLLRAEVGNCCSWQQVCESAPTQLDLVLIFHVGRTLYTIWDRIGTRALMQWVECMLSRESLGFRVLWGKILIRIWVKPLTVPALHSLCVLSPWLLQVSLRGLFLWTSGKEKHFYIKRFSAFWHQRSENCYGNLSSRLWASGSLLSRCSFNIFW